MKTFLTTIILYTTICLVHVHSLNAQDYTYLLKVNSLDDKEVTFDLKISSIEATTDEPIVKEYQNQQTPFSMNLKSGAHTIIVHKTTDDGKIESQIFGLVEGIKKGSASCSYNRAMLKAGPEGRYAATVY